MWLRSCPYGGALYLLAHIWDSVKHRLKRSEKLQLYQKYPDTFFLVVIFQTALHYRALGGICIVEGIISNLEPIQVYTGIHTGHVLTLCSFTRDFRILRFWCLQCILDPIPGEYGGKTTVSKYVSARGDFYYLRCFSLTCNTSLMKHLHASFWCFCLCIRKLTQSLNSKSYRRYESF